ncbi:MAG: hypothetical protein E7454_02780 [Ruminococcaceae bacterium]|nr:hypothetical protein [Oscillospiraceae bacterium]
MKLKPYVVRIRTGKIYAGTTLVDDKPRADMFLPAWMFTVGLLCLMFGMIMGIVLVVLQISVILIVLATVLVLLGVAALLCWKNQTIYMLPNDSFEYSTFLGNKTIYRFSEIKGIKRGSDSTTLFVGEGKVHIESIAIVSDRLAERINKQLEELGGNEGELG